MKAKSFQKAIYWPVFLFLKAFFSFQIKGQDNLRGLWNDPVIFVSNHRTYFDGLICAASMPREKFFPGSFFPVTFLVTDKFCSPEKNPLPWPLKQICLWFLKWNEVISVPEIGTEYREKRVVFIFLRLLAKRLKKNSLKVWIFPEGALNSREGELFKFRRGFLELHRLSGAPIIPVVVVRKRKNFLRKEITVSIGEPIQKAHPRDFQEKVLDLLEAS